MGWASAAGKGPCRPVARWEAACRVQAPRHAVLPPTPRPCLPGPSALVGCHHTKAMLLQYSTGLRLIIHSGPTGAHRPRLSLACTGQALPRLQARWRSLHEHGVSSPLLFTPSLCLPCWAAPPLPAVRSDRSSLIEVVCWQVRGRCQGLPGSACMFKPPGLCCTAWHFATVQSFSGSLTLSLTSPSAWLQDFPVLPPAELAALAPPKKLRECPQCAFGRSLFDFVDVRASAKEMGAACLSACLACARACLPDRGARPAQHTLGGMLPLVAKDRILRWLAGHQFTFHHFALVASTPSIGQDFHSGAGSGDGHTAACLPQPLRCCCYLHSTAHPCMFLTCHLLLQAPS